MGDIEVTDLATPAIVVEERSALAVGAAFGAYHVEGLAGSGGMGEVYRARDSRLDRLVAIKVVNREAAGELHDGAGQRLVREALALAKLSHPNILTIYEIGSVADELFVATEYVEGGTLREWLRAEPRSQRQILDVFVQAGRGLAAAHGAGLVHRDFKPANVLIDRQGRVRVCDFGLVTGGGVLRHDQPDDLTQGSLGTPAYMPPEQHSGGTVDASSDQYAFCVALYEALHDDRPFKGPTPELLLQQKRAGELPEPPAGARVPARLRAALARGLSPAPAQRHPSMGALLEILEKDPAAARRRLLVVTASALLAAGGALGVAAALGRIGPAAADPCGGAHLRLAGVWDDGVRAAVHERFLASGRPYAEDTYRRLAGALDEKTAAWTAMHRETCEATAVRREQSPALLDLRMSCLESRRRAIAEVTAIYASTTDGLLVDRAVQAAAGLGVLAPCADRAALSAVVPPPADPGLRLADQAMRRRLAAIRARFDVGQYKEAFALARLQAAEARALGIPQLTAESLETFGELQLRVGERAKAEASVLEAIFAAATSHDDRLVASAWSLLLWVMAQTRPGDVLALLPAAHVALARAGNPPIHFARILVSASVALGNKGDLPGAREHIVRAIALLEGIPEARLELASLFGELSGVLRRDGKLAEARRSAEHSLELFRHELGDRHPAIASARMALGSIASDAGDLAGAEASFRSALALAEAAGGSGNPIVAQADNNLALVLIARGDYDGARAAYERALALKERTLGKDHPDLGTTLDNLGALHTELGEYEAARRLHERAIAIYQPTGNVRVALSYYSLADAYLGEGDYVQARAYKERAVEMWIKLRGPEHPYVADALAGVARIELAAGQVRPALETVQRALVIRARSAADYPQEHAAETDLLGDVLHAQGKHAEALAQHQRALAILEKAGPAELALAGPLTGAGLCLVDLGRAAEALPLLERAANLRGATRGGPRAVARTRFTLARALREAGRDGDRSLALARSALELLRPLGGPTAAERAPIEAWLRR